MQPGPARSGEWWCGSPRQSRLLRYRRLCQFVGCPLSSPERFGARPFLGSSRRVQSDSRTVSARYRIRQCSAHTREPAPKTIQESKSKKLILKEIQNEYTSNG